jgi:hypothetical protein
VVFFVTMLDLTTCGIAIVRKHLLDCEHTRTGSMARTNDPGCSSYLRAQKAYGSRMVACSGLRVPLAAIEVRRMQRVSAACRGAESAGRSKKNSPTRTRTLNLAVNSRSLYRLSYRGICPEAYRSFRRDSRANDGKETVETTRSARGSVNGHEPSRVPCRRQLMQDFEQGQSTARSLLSACDLLVLLDRLLEETHDKGV